MAKWEVKNLFRLPSGRYLPCGLNIVQKLWWRFMPGVIINVKWPKGMIIAGPGPEDPLWFDYGGAAYIKFESADPNDHYRPWMEKHVGKQGRDWNWCNQNLQGQVRCYSCDIDGMSEWWGFTNEKDIAWFILKWT
jgi:hypothetical protein